VPASQVGFGLRIPSFPADRSSADEFIRQVRRLLDEFEGYFDSAWICDHFVPWARFAPRETPTIECMMSIAYLSALYRKLKWGALVLCNSYRNPALVAKMGATLQLLSGGRFILGIGAGWKEDEYLAYGYEFPDLATRVEQLKEALRIIRAMWQEGRVTFRGKHYRVEDAVCSPVPRPVPPIMVGGGSRRVLKVVAELADWWNVPNAPPDVYERKLKLLRRECSAIGRDYDEIVKTLACMVAIAETEAEAREIARRSPFVEEIRGRGTCIIGDPSQVAGQLGRYVELGATYFMVRFLDFPSTKGTRLFVEEVIPRVRELA